MALLAVLALAPACSSTRQLSSDERIPTTIRRLPDDGDDAEALAGGSEGARQIQEMIDRLLASDDPCAILTQRDVKGFQLDATTLASSSARRVLTKGVVDVYDHLLALVTDATVRPALQVQRDTFVQVLDLVDRYAANPTSQQGNDQIRALTTGDAFVRAQDVVGGWTVANCG